MSKGVQLHALSKPWSKSYTMVLVSYGSKQL